MMKTVPQLGILEKDPLRSSYFYRVAGLLHVTLLMNMDFYAGISSVFPAFQKHLFQVTNLSAALELYWFNIKVAYRVPVAYFKE